MIVPQERNTIRDILARLSRGETNLSKGECELINKLWNEFQEIEHKALMDQTFLGHEKELTEILKAKLVDEKKKSELYRRDTRDNYVQVILPYLLRSCENNDHGISTAFAIADKCMKKRMEP